MLPSSKCNWGIWNVYCHTAGESEMHFVAYSTFCCGGVLEPSVLIMRPMTDLCCHVSKCNWGIWNVYCHTAGESEMHFAPYSTFCCGGVLEPSVLIMRPMTDLCCHPANAIGEYGMFTATLLVRVRCTLHHTLLSAVEEFWNHPY